MKRVLFILIALLLVSPVFADSTQQSNKIFLNPFYRSSLVNNVNVSYNMVLDPPDRISSVTSATINFDVYLSPTVTFFAWVNGQTCNNPSYLVSTTFAGAGQARISFDCSNIIDKAGNYTITLRPSGANTGSVNGWLDVTYMNNPNGLIEVHGTDYVTGETATVFLQLKDDVGQAVNNATCVFTMYNSTSPYNKLFDNTPLINIPDSNGIHLFSFQTPSKTGVYAVDASCSYSFIPSYFYQADSFTALNYTFSAGQDLKGSITNVNAFNDQLYFIFTDVGGSTNFTYTWNNVTGNFSSLQFLWLGESNKAPVTSFYVFNWTSNAFIPLGNITLTSSAVTTLNPSGVDDFFTKNLPKMSDIRNSTNSVRVQIVSKVGSHNLFNNYINLKGFQNSGNIVEVKGSSEVHVYDNGFSSLNLSLENILNLTREINLTTHETLTVVNNINLTVGNILGLAQQINVTTLQNLAFVIEINATTHSNSNKLDTIIAIVTDSNMTIYMNKATLASILAFTNDTNRTVHNFNLTPTFNITINNLSEVLSQLNSINFTANQILNVSNQLEVKLDYLNGTINEINATVESNHQLLLNISGVVYEINLTSNQILNVSNQLEIKLDVINDTVNDIKDDTTNIIILLNNITVGNVSVTANVNISAIVEAILGADVEETIISTSGGKFAGESLLGGVAFAAPIDSGVASMCIDNQTLLNSVTKLRCVNNVCNTIVSNATVNCPFGCNSGLQPNECFPSKSQSNIFYFVILVAVVFILIVLISKYRR